MGIRDLAAKARAKLRTSPGADERIDQATDAMNEKFDNTPGDRYDAYPDRTRDSLNERMDDFTGRDNTPQNREPRDPRR